MHVLLSVLHVFRMVLVGRICLNTNEDILSLMTISVFLTTCMFDQVVLSGEIMCLSLLGG